MRRWVQKSPDVDALYRQTVVVDDDLYPLLADTLTDDILPTLLEMTGAAFTVAARADECGVVRVRVHDRYAVQQYTVRGSAVSDVLIEGGSWRGCKHGLYAWLAELGVRQLAPGDRWRIVPSLSDLRLPLSIDRTPEFSTIMWTAQGTISGNRWPVPAENAIAHIDAWYEFLSRNGRPIAHYTSVLTTPERQAFGGHSDPFAYGDKQAEFDADPTHFAQQDAEDPTRVVGAGIFHMTHDGTATGTDYTGTAGVVGIYADWITDLIDVNVAGLPDDHVNLKMGLSAAVADGANNCKDTKCIDLLRNAFDIEADATASDTSYWRNGRIYDVAKSARPNVTFEIIDYAYDRQSAPPTAGWSLNPNLHILLAQNTYAVDGLPARVLLERWAARRTLDGFTLSLYDYWALSAHIFSGAQFPSSMTWRRVREWMASDVEAFTGESTFAIGAIGPQWWGALRMNWLGDVDDDTLMTQWCADAFGAGATHVKRMLDRWWSQEWPTFVGHAYEMGLSFDDLAQADAAVVDDADSRARVAAMMAYLIFLHHRFNWYDYVVLADPHPAEGDTTAETLAAAFLTHVWRTAHTIMVDAKWVQDVVITDPTIDAGFETQWAIPADENSWAAWRTSNGIVPYTDAEIRSAFEALRETYPAPTPATYTTPDESSLIAPYSPTGTTLVTENYVYGDEAHPLGHEYIFQVRNGASGVLRVDIFCTSSPAAARFRLYNAVTGALVEQEDVTLTSDPTLHDFDLTALPVGFYRLFVENWRNECRHRILHQRSMPIVRVGSHNRVLWLGDAVVGGPAGTFPRYFFVPKNVTAFHVFATSDTGLGFRDGDDNVVTPEEWAPYVYRVVVPAGHDQEVWRWEGNPAGGVGHGTPRILDLPEWTAPTREQIIVPSNLWNEA